ncbi:MAG: hypothetical protein HKUEN02_04160 [Anaerolineaceae bacterium]|nr:MAG: hypothetical protein HKUEN02_04160 [Anaerolineaceae bacterium]
MRISTLFFLCGVEGAVALTALLLIPSESAHLSLARLALIAIFVALIALSVWQGFRPFRMERFAQPRPIAFLALLALTLSLTLFLLRYLNPQTSLPIYARLSPLLWYLLILSIQFALYLLYLKAGFHLDALRQNKPTLLASLAAFALLLALFAFVAFTKLGVAKDSAYWGEPGVPMLGWQFILAMLLGAAMLIRQFCCCTTQNAQIAFRSFLFPLSIYLVASILWLSVPISSLKNTFYAPITPPYTTPFPYSDAGFYDYLSQSLLIGADYFGGIPPRPLYVIFLAALHFLFGQDYVKIIAAQTMVFALFPVALYFLGIKLHSLAAGATIAFFAVFRELTTLWVSANTRTASVKMFVTDFATSLGIAFAILVVIRWFERRDVKSAIIAGGSFGLLLLLRTQSLLIVPVIVALAFFAHQRKMKDWLFACAIFGLTMTVTIAPWLIRNYQIVGQFAFDDPSQMAVIFSQYSFEGNLDISQFDFKNESLGRRLLAFTLENPGFVAGFVTNHFLNTEIGGLLTLPLLKPFNGLRAPVNLYWVEWDGALEGRNLALIVFYLAIIAVGLGAAWRRHRWAGLTPLAFNVGYALANGVSRFSSWRYNLPVDWIAYFYFGIGAIEILVWLASLFGANISKMFSTQTVELKRGSFKPKQLVIVAAFILLGSLPWLVQGIAQPRYTSTPEELKAQTVAQNPALARFLSQPDSQILEGRLLYPRFFRRNNGIASKTPWAVYAVRDFSRLGFIVINSAVRNVIFPADQPVFLTHGADVIVAGCQRDDYLEARWLYFPAADETHQSEASFAVCFP